jgi:methylmalonyl-CoA mutase
MDQNNRFPLFSEFPPVPTSVWEERIKTDLKGADYYKKLIWKTDEGFDVRPYYRAEDLEGLEYMNAFPDGPPITRGNQNENNAWSIREDIEIGDIDIANSKACEAIGKGVSSIGFNARLVSTHMQMGALLNGIDLEKTRINFSTSQSFPLTLELFIYEVIRRGVDSSRVHGSLNFDPISYLLLHGNFYNNWIHNLDETGYILETIKAKLPGYKAINVNGHYFQDSGSTLVQELAFTIASANEYLSGLTDKGLTIDEVAPHIQLSFAAGPNYFMEIAKLRAARLLWTRMVEQYQPLLPESLRVFIHSTTAFWNKSVFDPYVNLLRTTTEGMSAVLGNSDSVSVLPFNVSYQGDDDLSRRIARNQQLVLKEESYLDKIIDPAAGSYYIENLTDSMAVRAWDLFREVESRGGILSCIRSGFIQEEVAKSRRQKENDIAQRRIIMLGTTQFPNLQELMSGHVKTSEISPVSEDSIYEKLIRYRAAQPFEEIRLATERMVKSGHKRPSVFLFTMGNLAMLRARAGFATNFFGCAGYEIIDNPGFSTIAEGVEAALLSKSEIVVICSSDDEYPIFVPEIALTISRENQKVRLVVAGYPKDYIEEFKLAGIHDFIHVKSDLLSTLKAYQRIFGIE